MPEQYDTFPFQPDWRFESELDDRTEVSQAEDGSEKMRVTGGVFGRWELGFNDRAPGEYREARDFWLSHRKTTMFYVEDLGLEETQLGRFDSALKRSPLNPNSVSYSFVFYAPVWKETQE